jgi:hypothetical protein
MPKGKEAAYKRCVSKVKGKGGVKSPHGVCMASLNKKPKKKKGY